MQINYAYWSYYELQYKDIKPKVFAEEYYGSMYDIYQYEVWCFNGNPEFITVYKYFYQDEIYIYSQCIYDRNWNKLNFNLLDPISDKDFEQPKNLQKMLEYSEKLSKDFKLVRIDFFEKEGNLYINEMTFTPGSGFLHFTGENKDLYYGNKLDLKINKKED